MDEMCTTMKVAATLVLSMLVVGLCITAIFNMKTLLYGEQDTVINKEVDTENNIAVENGTVIVADNIETVNITNNLPAEEVASTPVPTQQSSEDNMWTSIANSAFGIVAVIMAGAVAIVYIVFKHRRPEVVVNEE